MLSSRLVRMPFALALLAVSVGAFIGCSDSGDAGYTATPKKEGALETPFFPVSLNTTRLAQIGPDACVDCHAGEVEDWRKSHHAKANRPVSIELDGPAFTPRRKVSESGVTYELYAEGTEFFMDVVSPDEATVTYELYGVIGYTPVRQYLARFPGNKLQTISASYDVENDKWFDVYDGQDRLPGEWGHWSGQGMNWNANCAYCHTTEYEKNFDFETNTYHSTWIQQGIACAECHGGLEAHIKAAKAGNTEQSILELTRKQTEENCATCHSRRDQLTADAFELGDSYHDHFGLSLPDQPGLYYPDGQIRDEVFVYGSFKMSRMAHASVTCMDCHNPHTLERILPVENNLLCMRCHETGIQEAPIIEPLAHSFHPAGSSGNQCIECHMPETVYMGNDWRADHGFHSPDPLMSKELGVPNACSSCHTDQSLDWAVQWSEKWYGEKLAKTRQRKRARAIAKAYAYEPSGIETLLELAKEEDIPAWTATYAGLLGNYLPNKKVEAFLQGILEHPDPLVRERAVSALARTDAIDSISPQALKDPSRSVRMATSRSLTAGTLEIPDKQAKAEWGTYQNFNSDRPQSLLLTANRAAKSGDVNTVRIYVDRAVQLDRANPEMYHQVAIILSAARLNDEAEARLYSGWEIAPKNPIFPYSLGLIAAERDQLDKAIGFLEEATSLEPQFYRAWYNLSLAYQKVNRSEDAERAMNRARGDY